MGFFSPSFLGELMIYGLAILFFATLTLQEMD